MTLTKQELRNELCKVEDAARSRRKYGETMLLREMCDKMPPDATFTRSTLGGGWLMPHTDSGKQLACRMGFDGCKPPECPEGFIVEPHEIETLVEWIEVSGAVVEEG